MSVGKFVEYLERVELSIGVIYILKPFGLIVTDKLKNKVLKKVSQRYKKYISKHKKRTGAESPLEMKAFVESFRVLF